MLNAIFKLFLFAISAVFLLAVSGYQQHVDIRRGVVTANAGTIKMGTHRPPGQATEAKPSMFDWVRYAMEGGPYFDATKMNSASMTDGMTDMQKMHYRADVDRRGQDATFERVEDMVRGYVGEPVTPRGIQFQSTTGQ